MSALSPRERLLRTIKKQDVDRPPVICPGGMMNAAIVDVMQATGNTFPKAHLDDVKMAELASDVQEYTGFENLGIPFCLTVEAEVMGSEINIGSLECEPKIAREAYPDAASVPNRDGRRLAKSGRVGTVAQAVHKLSQQDEHTPILGNVTGPVSTAASIIDPMAFFKGLRRDGENSHRVLDQVTEFLTEYAKLLIDNGATVISIGDPTATGEILGPKMFAEYAVPYINKVIDAIHELGAPVIVHICGDIKPVKHLITDIRSDVISTDAIVNLKALKDEYPQLVTMGNLSTFLLQWGPSEKIRKKTLSLINQQIDIISPACGLSTSTSLEHIRALTDTVKEDGRA
jgi:[methyl-Co(III) methanol-specific corrinoid protein]:coenzyme M methyltransferase